MVLCVLFSTQQSEKISEENRWMLLELVAASSCIALLVPPCRCLVHFPLLSHGVMVWVVDSSSVVSDWEHFVWKGFVSCSLCQQLCQYHKHYYAFQSPSPRTHKKITKWKGGSGQTPPSSSPLAQATTKKLSLSRNTQTANTIVICVFITIYYDSQCYDVKKEFSQPNANHITPLPIVHTFINLTYIETREG